MSYSGTGSRAEQPAQPGAGEVFTKTIPEHGADSKDQFIALLAHEIRSPLSTVSAAIDVLEAAPFDSEALHQSIALLRRQTATLSAIVEDLLDSSRVQRGVLRIKLRQGDLCQTLRTAAESMIPQLARRGQTLVLDIPDRPVPASIDEVRFSQVVSNLVGNASKYSPSETSVFVRLYHADHEAIITVKDCGVGIAKDSLEQIFDLYYQIEQGTSSPSIGLGIGLMLVRRIVELHGGKVVALSDGPGCGSEFRVALPITESTPIERVARQTARVLIVDDDPDLLQMLGLLLAKMGHQAKVVGNSSDAIREIVEFVPNLVLVDASVEGALSIPSQVSGMDIPKPMIVVHSGHGSIEDRKRSREAGFDGHVIKPLAIEDLRALLTASTS
jgi:CheY-like chemotaxis protein/two-component sensor histidine kinase